MLSGIVTNSGCSTMLTGCGTCDEQSGDSVVLMYYMNFLSII